MKRQIFIIAAAALMVCSCNGKNEQPAAQPAADTAIAQETDTATVVEPEAIVEPETAKPAPVQKAKAAPAKRQAKATETLYVESYDAKGLVWGHVTMQGDEGTGTIHDSDENTYSVKCRRHGNELFAVDQNSRRYVFRIN